MASSSTPSSDKYELDPVFLNSRREAIVIFGVWFLCLIWAVPVSYLMGYGQSVTPENVPVVFGIPRWTFWGIVFPWLVADVVTTWFCFRFFKEDELDVVDGEEAADDTATTASAGENA